ncbi:16S rRNA (cytidine(1402)-2'-O)-methyltransferase [Streptomyces californicus]
MLAGTPIGDVADAPPRLAAELERADVVAAEDTRRLRRLAQALGIHTSGRVVSYYEGNESARTRGAGGGPDRWRAHPAGHRRRDAVRLRSRLPARRRRRGAGHPGHRAVPGPSAVLAALALSGLPVDRFCFEGFLPRKAGERLSRLRENTDERRTMVFFEAPHRLDDTLAAMAEVFGADRRAAMCRELTKTYEEVKRGPLGELAVWAADGVRGEITVVVQGAPDAGPQDWTPRSW